MAGHEHHPRSILTVWHWLGKSIDENTCGTCAMLGVAERANKDKRTCEVYRRHWPGKPESHYLWKTNWIACGAFTPKRQVIIETATPKSRSRRRQKHKDVVRIEVDLTGANPLVAVSRLDDRWEIVTNEDGEPKTEFKVTRSVWHPSTRVLYALCNTIAAYNTVEYLTLYPTPTGWIAVPYGCVINQYGEET